jgi:hypothetical protein
MGELSLPGSAPTTGAAWNDSGRRRDERGLKHRAREAIRVVPSPPPLTAVLRDHIREFGVNGRGRLFSAARDVEGDLPVAARELLDRDRGVLAEWRAETALAEAGQP